MAKNRAATVHQTKTRTTSTTTSCVYTPSPAGSHRFPPIASALHFAGTKANPAKTALKVYNVQHVQKGISIISIRPFSISMCELINIDTCTPSMWYDRMFHKRVCGQLGLENCASSKSKDDILALEDRYVFEKEKIANPLVRKSSILYWQHRYCLFPTKYRCKCKT